MKKLFLGLIALAILFLLLPSTANAATHRRPAPAPGTTTAAPAPPPAVGGTWWLPSSAHALPLHWVLGGPLDVNSPVQLGLRDFNGAVLPQPAVIDIDIETNTAATVATLHTKGYKVIGYMDAGVYETYRTDASRFPASVIGSPDSGWNGSYWLDIRQVDTLAPIMKDRIASAKAKGFDAVEPDEIDGWENSSGFPLTYADQLNYNRWVASWIHDAGLTALQKGDIIQTRDLVNYFDCALIEEAFQYNEVFNPWNPDTNQEQVGVQAYTQQGKAVWMAEYKNFTAAKWTSIGQTSVTNHLNTARYKLGLPNNGGRLPAPGYLSW